MNTATAARVKSNWSNVNRFATKGCVAAEFIYSIVVRKVIDAYTGVLLRNTQLNTWTMMPKSVGQTCDARHYFVC